jgi:hypothetical protein
MIGKVAGEHNGVGLQPGRDGCDDVAETFGTTW